VTFVADMYVRWAKPPGEPNQRVVRQMLIAEYCHLVAHPLVADLIQRRVVERLQIDILELDRELVSQQVGFHRKK